MTRRWTAETDAEADTLYRTWTVARIRQCQDICGTRMEAAFRKQLAGEDDPPGRTWADIGADQAAMHDALTREMFRRFPI